MRLIDADVLSDRMYHDAFETDSDMQMWDSGCWIRYKMFENAIKSMPTIEVQHWIPVTERLPEMIWESAYDEQDPEAGWYESERCTICMDSGEVVMGQFVQYINDGHEMLTVYENKYNHEIDGKPIAWMPLPHPYREEKA